MRKYAQALAGILFAWFFVFQGTSSGPSTVIGPFYTLEACERHRDAMNDDPFGQGHSVGPCWNSMAER